jgi:CubicO group peptidase (beta-lactamase class C family)
MRHPRSPLPLLLMAILFLLPSAGAPASAPAQDDPRAEQVDRYLREQMQALRIPGLQVAVVKDGRIALLRSYGVASLELSAPVTDRTVFAINSITKAFTGVAVMRQVEAGRLDLDAPVSAYLDDLPDTWRAVTIRQLLTHMSGLPDINRAPTVNSDQAAAWEWVLAQPVYVPGERFYYCQTNYTLLQRIINTFDGQALDATLAGPQLGIAQMASTGYGDSSEVIPNKGPSYRYTYAAPGGPGTLHPTHEIFLPMRRASSGMNSTAEDMARWIIAIGQDRILDRASLETMWTPVAFNNGQVGQWGLGWLVLRRGTHRAVGMTGGGRAAFFIYPEHDVAIVLLTNLAGAYPEDLIDRIAALYAPDLKLTGVPALRIALQTRGYDDADAIVAELQRDDPEFDPAEAELNDWGYRLLSSGRPRQALAVLKIAADLHPDSANAYDSLGEAYAANGETTLAISNYRRSLELDPGNEHAVRQLERLQQVDADTGSR